MVEWLCYIRAMGHFVNLKCSCSDVYKAFHLFMQDNPVKMLESFVDKKFCSHAFLHDLLSKNTKSVLFSIPLINRFSDFLCFESIIK